MKVKLSNGQLLNFPDSMSREDIKSAIQKKFPKDNGNSPDQKEEGYKPGGLLGGALPVLGNAALTMGKDVVGAVGNVADAVDPLARQVMQDPGRALSNTMAAVPQIGQSIINTPHNLPAYLAHLGFIKPETAKKIGSYIPEKKDITSDVNQFMGLGEGTEEDKKIQEGLQNLFGLMPAGKTVGKAAASTAKSVAKAGKSAIEIPSKLIDKASPGKASEQLLKDLSHGSENTEQATSSIVKDIQEAHNSRAEESGTYLDHALDRAGNEKIYEKVDPLISTKMDQSKLMMSKVKDLNVGELFDTFKSDPTFHNAHNLKSELGVMIGDLQKIPGKTIAQNAEIQNLRSVRNKLKSDINNFLEKRDSTSNENLKKVYDTGIDLYRDNVSHYLSTPKLRQIVREGRTSVPNVHKIFESPYDITKNGKTQLGPINKILKDLPKETRDKLLFRKIGGFKHASDPEKLIKSLEDSEQLGYSKLHSQDIKDKLLGIKSKSKNLTRMKYASGIAGLTGMEEFIRRMFMGAK